MSINFNNDMPAAGSPVPTTPQSAPAAPAAGGEVINLNKGGSIDLTKTDASLDELMLGLFWDSNRFNTGGEFDCDASVFMLGADGKCAGVKDFIYYDHRVHESGAVVHNGDNRTGAGDGDDETIDVTLSKVPEHIQKLVVVVTIYDADARGQNFGGVENSGIRIVNKKTGQEIARADLNENFSFETAVVFAELYRYNGSWKFKAIESGFNGGLAAACASYGLAANGG